MQSCSHPWIFSRKEFVIKAENTPNSALVSYANRINPSIDVSAIFWKRGRISTFSCWSVLAPWYKPAAVNTVLTGTSRACASFLQHLDPGLAFPSKIRLILQDGIPAFSAMRCFDTPFSCSSSMSQSENNVLAIILIKLLHDIDLFSSIWILKNDNFNF